MLTLADVSEFQTVDWAKYGATNPAVIVRAHNGWRADNKWAANVAGSRKFCQWRGFYQYLPASVDPRQAARDFAATVGPMLPGEVAILDLEEGAGDQRQRRADWLDELHAAVEWTYSGLYFARQHLPGVSLEWVAAYQSTEPTDTHTLWQCSNARQFPGIGTADCNQFNGTLADLIALTAATPEADMPLTDDDVKKIWGFPGLDNATGGSQTIWRTVTEATALARQVPDLKAQVADLKTQLATAQAQLKALSDATGVDVSAVSKAIVEQVSGSTVVIQPKTN
jgi:hypothetical protein